MTTGGALRRARRAAGLTQKDLAARLGVESITVSRWERGVTSPSLPRLRRIAEITETTVAALLGQDGEAKRVGLRFELFHFTAPIELVLAPGESIVCVNHVGENRQVWIGGAA